MWQLLALAADLGAYYEPIAMKEANVELVYLCDVMKSQREKAAANFAKHIDYKPKLENDIRKVIDDKNCGCDFQCHTRPLAHSGSGYGHERRKTRLS
jgi:hypothetical protein